MRVRTIKLYTPLISATSAKAAEFGQRRAVFAITPLRLLYFGAPYKKFSLTQKLM
jgi:hypothetical protein